MPSAEPDEEETVVDPRVEFFNNLVTNVWRLRPEKWQKFYSLEDTKKIFQAFFSKDGNDKLFIALTSAGTLQILLDFPPHMKNFVKVFFFLKNSPGDPILAEVSLADLKKSFSYGEICPNVLEHFGLYLNEIAFPLLLNNKNQSQWSKTIKEDLTHHVYKLQRETAVFFGQSKGTTVLPLPLEAPATDKEIDDWLLIESPDELTLNSQVRKVLYAFETVVIEWAHQVDAVLKKDSAQPLLDGIAALPFVEIEFWRSKKKNLENIYDQMTAVKVHKMAELLEKSKSAYFHSFKKLFTDVVKDLMEAQDISMHLSPMQRLLEDFQQVDFDESQRHMDPIMHMVALLWAHCKFYREPARIIVLLQEICNLVIEQCRQFLAPEELFKGEVEDTLEKVNKALEILQYFRHLYESHRDKLKTYFKDKKVPAVEWEFAHKLVFARFDAVVNRVEVVKELMDTYMDLMKLEKVELAGCKGNALSKQVLMIADAFNEAYKVFTESAYDPMDPLNMEFLTDYHKFLDEMETIYKRLANIFDLAFHDCSGLESVFKLIAIYTIYIDKPYIKESIESKYPAVIELMDVEVEQCKVLYDTQLRYRDTHGHFLVHMNMPQISGALEWAKEMRKRILAPFEQMKFINERALETSHGKRVLLKFQELMQLLSGFEDKVYKGWSSGVNDTCSFNLKQCILKREPTQFIAINFDPKLVAVLREVKYLEIRKSKDETLTQDEANLLGKAKPSSLSVPGSASKIYSENDTFRRYITTLDLTVIRYNYVRSSVLNYEVVLIEDELKRIDVLLMKGETSMAWNSSGLWEYIELIRDEVRQLYDRLVASKANVDTIQLIMTELAKCSIFERKEGKHETLLNLDDRTDKLAKRYAEVEEAGRRIHAFVEENRVLFNATSNSEPWKVYLERVDEIVMDGFVEVLTTSLRYLLKETENRPENVPLLMSKMELQETEVKFFPGLEMGIPDSLYDLMDSVLADIFRQAQYVQRVAKHLAFNEDTLHYQGDLEEIDDLNHLRYELMTSRVSPVMAQACEYRDTFNSYSYLWTDDRTEYLRLFLLYGRVATVEEIMEGIEETAPTLDQYKEQIDQFENLFEEISKFEGTAMFQYWFRLDLRPFKQSLLNTVKRWSLLFKQHLMDHVINSLAGLEDFIKVTDVGLAYELKEGDYDGLVSVMGHLQAQRERQAATDAMFEPIHAMIELLTGYGQEMPPEVYTQLEELPEKWNNTKKTSALIRQALAPLQNHEVAHIREKSTEFDVKQNEFREAFKLMLAFQYKCPDAYHELDEWNRTLSQQEHEMQSLMKSGKLFDVNVPEFKMIKLTRKDLILLKNLWDMIFMVRLSIEDWQTTPWQTVDVDKMDLDCKKFSKDLRTLDSIVRNWDAFIGAEQEVKNMMSSLHAVAMLSDPAIRDRHWAQLMTATGVHFIMTEDTTLAELLSLNLHRFEDEVSSILEQANKERSMEDVLAGLEVTWKTMELEHEKHARTGVTVIKASEEVIETLEDNQSQLQNLLNSKHNAYFINEIREWVGKLSTSDQVISIYLEVQRTWMNLESIFIGTEDIRVQLPEPSKLFDKIDVDFKQLITELEQTTNVVEATNQPGLYERLEAIQNQLSVCEKALMDYMETKRLAFPRFYFVSHNDLLDILSHGNEPESVMRHLTKLFDSISKLKLSGSKVKTASAMYSKESEYLEMAKPAALEGRVEEWLNILLKAMRATMVHTLQEAVGSFEEKSRDQWIFDFPAQVALTGSQIGWSTETNLAFQRLEEGFENSMKDFNKKQITQLNTLITMLIGDLSAGDRQKIMTICTIDVHNRDVIAKLILQKAENALAFTWLSQLRHRWDEVEKDCYANICDAEFLYYHEYLGNTPRLVITPLTDRCYITLTQSLHLYMSGAPAGPAGTGKTETTKDLGRALGMMVYVFNCSEQMDYKSIGNIYKGLAQSGAWGCFDEFNRISVEVLSVVAVQVKSIQDALKVWSKENDRFHFLGEDISLAPTVGIFITMNPGYAGRTELPENLKALFRPCAMVVPDFDLICEIMLVAEGFLEARLLARKFITLYNLCKELLSKQDHYDWGLRAIKSVLVVAGTLKRSDRERPEDQVLMRALRDFNIPKIVTDDLPIFMGLIGDLFPALDVPRKRDPEFEKEIRAATLDAELQPEDNFVLKCVQLQELFAVRHSVFIVGNAGTGKSQIWKILQRTYKKAGKKPVAVDVNPKAVTNDELFGIINPATREWKDGLFSVVMRDLANVAHDGPKWIVLDGDIDPMWIESLNTVMDDNKVLTLASNERIPLTPSMRLLFEISHLKTATPATVSRAGILYINPGDLGWQPFVTSWINKRTLQTEQANLTVLFDKYVPLCLEAMRTKFKKITPIAEISHVQTLCYLLESLLQPQHGLMPDASKDLYEQFFVFCCVWAFGGCMFQDQLVDHRVEFSRWFITEFKQVKFPKDAASVFDVFIDPETKKFESWQKQIPQFELDPDIPLQATLVYTNETVRLRYFIDLLVAEKRPVMLVGNAGTGKSVLMQDKLNKLTENSDQFMVANVPFNFYTTSEMLQRILERPLEKKAGRNFGPPSNRQLIYFIDDMNMPEVDTYFTVQPHTLIRQHLDYSHWYDRTKLSLKDIHNTQYVSCMNPTAGSFTINPRLQRHFSVFAMSFPGAEALSTIYASILHQHLSAGEFLGDLKRPQVTKDLVDTALTLQARVTQTFLPTAVKFHYSFNLRDLSSIFQGLLFSTPECLPNKPALARLWLHECERVYCDKLVDDEDVEKFHHLLKECARKGLSDWFSSGDEMLWKRPLLYCHFARHIGDEKYMPVESLESITKILTEGLDTYNEINAAMNLVLFEDAIQHILRISRILELPRGNALLVGVGGSGKQSLSRLAAFLSSLEVFQITLRKGYGIADLKADLAQMYIKTGQKSIGTVFLLTDAQVADEMFLVLVNDLLASGDIPDLFADDEVENICNGLRSEVKGQGLMDTKENIWKFFIDRVRQMLKVVLCFSPVGNTLRVRSRKFPALVNSTVIDWFHEWPEQALISVSRRFLNDVELLSEELRDSTSEFMSYAHKSVNEMSQNYLLNDRRYNYTTPKSFLEQIALYENLLKKKHVELMAGIERLENGLLKLESTAEQVDELKAKLAVQEEEVKKREADAMQILMVVEKDTDRVSKEKAIADSEEIKVATIAEEVNRKAQDCAKDLARAEPALEAAQKALNTLNKDNLTEMKAFPQPPPAVVMVMEAVQVLMASNGKIPRDRSWKAAKILMGKVDGFLDMLVHYDKDNIHENCLKAAKEVIKKPGFDPDSVRTKSLAASGICSWVINIVKYYEVYCEVKPKRDALAAAEAELKAANDKLNAIRARVTELEKSLAKLNAEFEAATEERIKVQNEAASTAKTIELANRLVSGLASENDRWGMQVAEMKKQALTLPGDVLVTVAFLSYVGYFTKQYRTDLLNSMWFPFLKNQKVPIPISEDLDPLKMLVDDAAVATWNNEGLPSDRMSIENAAILTICERWPLMIDPQLQGVKWIKTRFEAAGLKVVRLGQKKTLDVIEEAVTNGDVVLIENIGENIDPVLDALLGRNTIKKGKAIRIGDKEVDFNPKFRLILHTKLANPHYKPEMQAQTTLINFTVTRDGLEEQLLAAVVQKEKPELEQIKSDLTRSQNEFKITLKTLEDALLARLSAATGNFLGDYALVENLETNKATAADIANKVEESRVTEVKINHAREFFRPCAKRASLIFFIMNDLNKISAMYQFSLKAFSVVFEKAIDKAEEAEEEEERVKNILDSITFSVYVYTTRGLFEKDKLIFTTQMTFQILLSAKTIAVDELDFLLRFPVIPNLTSPIDFISHIGWGGIKALVALESNEFKGLDNDIVGSAKRWKKFVESECPEREKFPQEWKNKTPIQRLCMMRALRPDRMTYAIKDFVSENLGSKYVEGRQVEFAKSYEESGPATPIFFILSAGVDPLKDVEAMGRKLGMTSGNRNFHNVSLGQGQEVVAEDALKLGAAEGHWVVLQNVHLVAKWLNTLEKALEHHGEESHENFRVFISAEPSASHDSHIIPQGILETSIKITNEPPTGMFANLHKAFANFDQETLEKCSKQVEFQAIIFSLCYFHAVVSERRKFGAIGWNRSYPFNNGDLTISVEVLYNYLEANPKVPWEDLRYIFGQIMYGGHITDDWDRRLCRAFLEEYMKPELTEGELFLAPGFRVPPTLDYKGYQQYMDEMLPSETPALYGLHPNAEIEFLTTTANELFRTVFEMQPRDTGAGAGAGVSKEEKIRTILDELVDKMPDSFNMPELLAKVPPEERTPFVVVAIQECERMNMLMSEMRRTLKELDLGLKGELTISVEMEALGQSLFLDQVPDSWSKKAYPSLFPLGLWYGDLQMRVRELETWVSDFQLPGSVWLAGFFNPQSFLTAIMQQMARKNEWPLDRMCLQVDVTKKQREDLGGAPREGAYVHGLFMEGAQWDHGQGIAEATLMDLAPAMPVMFIRAIPVDRQDIRSAYPCPVYKTKQRGPTFVWTFNLKTKNKPSRWILAGVALLLQV